MTLRPATAVVGASLLASACVLVPVTVERYDSDCRLVTHHMALRTVQLGANDPLFMCQREGCVVALAVLGVAAASVVVSGSIVVIGNVVYWAEERSGCPARL